jgi:hypothetical protein
MTYFVAIKVYVKNPDHGFVRCGGGVGLGGAEGDDAAGAEVAGGAGFPPGRRAIRRGRIGSSNQNHLLWKLCGSRGEVMT